MPTPTTLGVDNLAATNVALIGGTIAAAPRRRELPSGDQLVELDVTTRGPHGTATVPVVWPDPPATASRLTAGDDVIVAGIVRRRFFRAGGATQSRTELVAASVVPRRQRATVRRLLATVAGVLERAGVAS